MGPWWCHYRIATWKTRRPRPHKKNSPNSLWKCALWLGNIKCNQCVNTHSIVAKIFWGPSQFQGPGQCISLVLAPLMGNHKRSDLAEILMGQLFIISCVLGWVTDLKIRTTLLCSSYTKLQSKVMNCNSIGWNVQCEFLSYWFKNFLKSYHVYILYIIQLPNTAFLMFDLFDLTDILWNIQCPCTFCVNPSCPQPVSILRSDYFSLEVTTSSLSSQYIYLLWNHFG